MEVMEALAALPWRHGAVAVRTPHAVMSHQRLPLIGPLDLAESLFLSFSLSLSKSVSAEDGC